MNILRIYSSKKIRNYLPKICEKAELREDLFHFCLLKLMEKDHLKLEVKLESDGKTLEDYFLGMLVHQIKSNTSEFYKVYRNHGFSKKILKEEEFIDNREDIKIEYDDTEDRMLFKIDRTLSNCNALNVDIFKMKYYDGKTTKEISEYYNISETSVERRIKYTRKQIRDGLGIKYRSNK